MPRIRVMIVSGSQEQSDNLYKYFKDLATGSAYERLVKESMYKTKTYTIAGGWIQAFPASHKKVHGPRPDVVIVDEACFVPGTKILTDIGFINIEDLNVGNSVISHTGCVRKIKKTFTRMVDEELIELTIPGNSQKIRVTKNHPVLIMNDGWMDWVKAGDLNVGDVICHPIQKREEKVFKPFMYGSSWHGNRPFKVECSDAWMKFVGYYLAEGSTNKSRVFISFHSDEVEYQQEVMESVKEIFGYDKAYLSPCPKNTTNVVICSKNLVKFLHEEFGGNSATKKISKRFLSVPKRHLDIMMKAFYNGDGYTYHGEKRKRKDSNWIHIKSAYLAGQFYNWAVESGYNPSVHFDPRKPHYYVYYQEPGPYQKRWRYKGYIYTQIKSIDRVRYTGPVYNIEVDVDNSYLLPSMAVHNCKAESDIILAAQSAAMSARVPKFMVMSTPDAMVHIFHDWYEQAASQQRMTPVELAAVPRYERWRLYHITAYECKWITPETIESLTAKYGGKNSHEYKIYVLGEFAPAEGLVFNEEWIRASIIEDIPSMISVMLVDENQVETMADVELTLGNHNTGLDVGGRTPSAVVTAGEDQLGNVFIVDDVDIPGHSGEEPVIAEHKRQVVKYYSRSNLDSAPIQYHMNRKIRAALIDDGLPGCNFISFQKEKANMISAVKSLFESGMLFIHKRCSKLINQLFTYTYDENKQDNMPMKGNDDHVDAFLLAVFRYRNNYMTRKYKKMNMKIYNLDEHLEPVNPSPFVGRGDERLNME
jgi:hypothetical protein